MPDFLDDILEPQKKAAADTSKGHWLVVGVRAKSSEENEASEAQYLATRFLPIPFYNEAGELEPLSNQDLADLRDMGVSPDEYKVLVGAMTIDEYEQLMEQQP